MICKRLRHLRASKELTQQDIANKLGISRQRYNNYETGKRIPDDETKIQIANFYGVSIDYLIGQTDNPTPYDKPKPKTNDKHVDKKLNEFIDEVEKTDGLMFSGGPIDAPTKEVLLKMLRTTKDMAEKINENNKK